MKVDRKTIDPTTPSGLFWQWLPSGGNAAGGGPAPCFASPLSSTPIAQYSFDNVLGTPSLSDAGINGINLVANGLPTGVAGKDGDAAGAFTLNGTSQYLTASTCLPTGSQARSVCAWVNPTSYGATAADDAVIAAYGDAAKGTGQLFGLAMKSAIATPGIVSGAVYLLDGMATPLAATSASPMNTWIHYCAVYNGTTSFLYANGSLIGSAARSLNTTTADNLMIGAWKEVSGVIQNYLKGKIDDVRVYNRALTALEVRQISVQVSNGLVARYDFNGDANDVSGFGNNATTFGAALATDRFGQANAAYTFDGITQYITAAGTGLPVNNLSRTVCAWAKPSFLSGAIFSEVVTYGNGYGLGMDGSGVSGGRIFALDVAGDLIYNNPHGLNVWRHVCVTFDGVMETLYLDAYPIAAGARTLTTTSGVLNIGRHNVSGGDYFNGTIDDVRVYNRSLSLVEIQTLGQQPNKRIFVTAATYSGDLMNTVPAAATGIGGADAKCMADVNRPNASTYKAMIVNVTAPIYRQACLQTTADPNCATNGITNQIDWVLRPNVTYVRPDGVTSVFTADWNGVFDFTPGGMSFSHPIGAAAIQVWTGMTPQWVGDVSDASAWTNAAMNGVFGLANGTSQTAAPGVGGVLYHGWGVVPATSVPSSLYCVEQ